MDRVEDKHNKPQDQSKGKDENRFSRLIKRLDTQDKDLGPEKRKRKWMYILAGLFLLYLVSFLLPAPDLSHQSLEPENAATPKGTASVRETGCPKVLTFEMPVDSFENILKKQLHEKLPEKK